MIDALHISRNQPHVSIVVDANNFLYPFFNLLFGMFLYEDVTKNVLKRCKSQIIKVVISKCLACCMESSDYIYNNNINNNKTNNTI